MATSNSPHAHPHGQRLRGNKSNSFRRIAKELESALERRTLFSKGKLKSGALRPYRSTRVGLRPSRPTRPETSTPVMGRRYKEQRSRKRLGAGHLLQVGGVRVKHRCRADGWPSRFVFPVFLIFRTQRFSSSTHRARHGARVGYAAIPSL